MHSWRDVSINSLFASVVREVTRSAQHFLPPTGAEPILTPVHSEINRFNQWLVRQPSGSIYVAVMHSFHRFDPNPEIEFACSYEKQS